MAQSERTHEGRISGLEQGFESLQGEIHGLRTDLRSFTRDVRSELGTKGRMQWGPIIAGVSVLLALLSAYLVGPVGNIERNDERITAMTTNRFTDRDGGILRRYVEDKYSTAETLSAMRHDAQELELQQFFKLLQGQLDTVWEQLREMADEDFKRPEADVMRKELLEEIRILRERYITELSNRQGG